jgi:hypothetical protein
MLFKSFLPWLSRLFKGYLKVTKLPKGYQGYQKGT